MADLADLAIHFTHEGSARHVRHGRLLDLAATSMDCPAARAALP
jgi:hypothetical protein